MISLFNGCKALTSLDLTSFDIGKVIGTPNMFNYCNQLSEIKVSRNKWKIDSVRNTNGIFSDCKTSSVTYVD